MKKLLFLTLGLFFLITGVADARMITFKLVNEFGVPQPIEVRGVYGGEIDEFGWVGFGEVRVPYHIDPDNLTVRITRRYADRPSKSSPEGPGILYTITPTSPSTVTKKVPTIKSSFKPRSVKLIDRAILGVINDFRQDNNLPRLGRVPEIDKLASLWVQEIASNGNQPVFNQSLMWNYGLDAFLRRTVYFWSGSKASVLSKLDSEICLVSGKKTPCKYTFLEEGIEAIAVATVNDLSYAFFLMNCSGVVGCQQTDDSGDSKLLNTIFCRNCSSLKQNPELKIIKKNKKPRRLRVLVATKKGARGVAKLVIRQKTKRLLIKGKKTSYGFIFKSSKKRSLIRYNKKFKARVVFRGRGNWQSSSLIIR
jgi:hypothetical protein